MVSKLPTGFVDFVQGRQIVGLVRLPFIDMLHLGAAGAPEGHPVDDVLTETVFGNAKL